MGVEALRARADAKAADLAPIIKELRVAGKTNLRPLMMQALQLRAARNGRHRR